MESTANDRLAWTVDDLARHLGVCNRVVVAQIKQGYLPARKLGRRTVVLHADAEKWLDRLPCA